MSRRDRRRDRLTEAELGQLEALDLVLAGGAAVESDAEHTRLSRLVAAVREARPPLRPAFADELGSRVSDGFARRPQPATSAAPVGPGAAGPHGGRDSATPVTWWGTRRRWLTGLGAAASLAAGIAIFAGGLGSPGSSSGPSGIAGSSGSAVGGGVSSPALGAATPAPAVPVSPQSMQSVGSPGSTTPTAAGGGRAVESDASLSLLAPRGQVQRVADGTIAATDRLGGVVESSHVSVGGAGGSQATLALEVPSPALDRTLAAISSLAHVSSRSQDTQDITDSTQAARERLSESRDERIALLRQLGGARTPNQVASIHAQLGLVDGRITRDEKAVQSLLGHARTASVDVTIAETRAATGGGGGGSVWRPTRALDDALRVLEACFAVLVIGLALLVPAAAVGALGWSTLRTLRRRRRHGALAGS